MSQSKRLLKITGIVLGLILVFGYLAFSTLLFSPTEGSWKYRISALVPRTVDVYVAKAKLEDWFAPFPQPQVLTTVADTAAWRAFDGSSEQERLLREAGIPEALAQLEEALAQAPVDVDPLSLFGGREVAIAGDLEGKRASSADWAVYGRVDFLGKLAVSLLPRLDLAAQGVEVETLESGGLRLSGRALARELFLGRVQDVVVVGTAAAFVDEALSLSQTSGENSLRLATTYEGPVVAAMGPDQDEIELFANLRTTFESLELPDPWPDPKSTSFAQAFLARLIQAPACKNAAGIVGFDGGLSVDLSGTFSSEKITPFQQRVYREKGFEHDQVLQRVARMAPEDTAVLAYLHGPVADLLREALASLEPALRQNLEDVFRSTGRWASLDALIGEIGEAAHDRLLLIVRENDYGPIRALSESTGEEMSPESDGRTVFAFTLVTWLRGDSGVDTVNSIRDAIGRNPDKFGLKGGVAGDPGYYRYEEAGMDTREFWSPFVPGTGMIASLVDDEGRCIITNHERMFRQVINCLTRQERSLADDPTFQALLNSSTPASNLLLWVNPRAAAGTLEELAKAQVDLDLRNGIDWTRERRRVELDVLPSMFPGKQRNQLSADERTRLDDAIDVELQDWFREHSRAQRPLLEAEALRRTTYLRAVSALLASLRVDPRDFSFSLRGLTPFYE